MRTAPGLDTVRKVNLAARPVFYVVDAVDETTIETDDARLRLELRAQRWWMKTADLRCCRCRWKGFPSIFPPRQGPARC